MTIINDLSEVALRVCEIAKEAGHFLREERKVFSLDRVEQKQSHDYVSYVDKAAERLLVGKLGEIVPGAGFITEEETIGRSDGELNWIVDPLDGTTNFIQNNPPYCVSIALRNGSDFLIGVVYEVCMDECFYAWKNGGAYLNGNKIGVSEKGFDKAFIGVEPPYNAEEYKPVAVKIIDRLYGNVSGLRVNGSAAMGLCYVAAGRYDGWMEAFIKPWDYSAGIVIVREAGGRITDYAGNEDIIGTHHIIASNSLIHNELIATVS